VGAAQGSATIPVTLTVCTLEYHVRQALGTFPLLHLGPPARVNTVKATLAQALMPTKSWGWYDVVGPRTASSDMTKVL